MSFVAPGATVCPIVASSMMPWGHASTPSDAIHAPDSSFDMIRAEYRDLPIASPQAKGHRRGGARCKVLSSSRGAVCEPLGEPTPTRPLALLPKLLPELTMAAMALALALWPERVGEQVRASLHLRLPRRGHLRAWGRGRSPTSPPGCASRPPWWAVPIIAGLVLMIVSPEILTMLRGAFAEGWQVFVPFLWSVLERLRELWTMPVASRLEKMRRRALVSGRIALVLLFGGAATATADHHLRARSSRITAASTCWAAPPAGGWRRPSAPPALDVVRVHRPSFARRPRALVPKLDALGVDYLEPLL